MGYGVDNRSIEQIMVMTCPELFLFVQTIRPHSVSKTICHMHSISASSCPTESWSPLQEIMNHSRGTFQVSKSQMPWHLLVLGCLSIKPFEKCTIHIHQSEVSGSSSTQPSRVGERRSDKQDLATAPFGRILGVMRNKGNPGELNAASLGSSGEYPRLAAITDMDEDAGFEVMTAMGVHAPQLGAIGKGVEVLVMEKGFLMRPHIAICRGGPCTVTYLVLVGQIRVLSWGCDLGANIWGMSDQEINFLSESNSTRNFNQANPHFRPSLYHISANQALTVRDGCFHLVIASSDAGAVSTFTRCFPCNSTAHVPHPIPI